MPVSHPLRNSAKLLIAAGCLICALPLASQTLSFTVSTGQPWTDTGLDLQVGQTLTITASAAAGASGCDPMGVSGATGANLPIPNQLPGALLARLQGNGPAWFIGAKQQLLVQESGHLWLGVNAAGDPPCKGAFSVKVALGSASANAASAATTPAAGSTATAAGTKTASGAGSATAAPDNQVKDVKGALETAAQTWLSGQLGVGGSATGATSSSATGNGGANGVPALSIPADKISKTPLDAQLRKDIDGLPRRVNDQFQHQGDMVNFVIVGNQVKVADALTAADWHIADRDVKESVLKAALETYEKKAYLTMPMSELYLYGRVQDYGYEQAEPYAVVASRHHFRIWKAPFQWNGQDVWVGAGTHDIGFEKDQRNGNVTHKIDPAVDGERDNIGATLEKSGKVKSLTYYLPPSPVQDARNATGGGYHSDGRILVVTLN